MSHAELSTGGRAGGRRPVWACAKVLLVTLSAGGLACGSDDELAPSISGPSATPTTTVGLDAGNTSCATPSTGCACVPQQVVDCGWVQRRAGDYIACSLGKRTCSLDGTWGECVGDRLAEMSVPVSLVRTRGMGTTQPCVNNPCDPYCRIVNDTPNGVETLDGGTLTDDASSSAGLALDGGLTLQASTEVPPQRSACTSLVVSPAVQAVTVTEFRASRLKAEYFNQYNSSVSEIPSSWTVTATRRESNIDYQWGNAAPGATGISADRFSVRWTGKLVPTTTETYTLYGVADDGMRIWLNGTLIMSAWRDQSPTETASTAVPLIAGKSYDLRVEYYENGGGATARLLWSTPTIAKQAVPAAVMLGPEATVSPLAISPAAIDFSLKLEPANCFTGEPEAIWTLDKLERATIDNSGLFALLSGVAGPVNVTAYAGEFSTSARVDVKVDATDNESAPSGSVAQFAMAPSGTDPMVWLYPYDNTVFPLGIKPPLLQYDTGGTAATAVRLSLQYPTTGTPSFVWSTIVPEPASGQLTIPRDVWRALEQTAKGSSATIALSRILAGAPRAASSRTVTFSTTPVRGRIYYTQYGRNGTTNVMVADPGSDSPATPAFAGTDTGGTSGSTCPVCHSVSAQGTVFATADRSFSAFGGLSTVAPSGSLSLLSDFVPSPTSDPYRAGGQDWRGFAWAALTADGRYALTANNIWGNSNQAVVGIDTTTRTVSVPTTMLSGGTGTGLLARYFAGTNFTGASWKRFDPIVDFDLAEAAPGGPIGVDYSVRRSGQVQAYFSELYTFEVETTDGVALTVDGIELVNQRAYQGASTIFSGQIAMRAGQKVPIQLDQSDSSGESKVRLWWSSPSTPRTIVPQSQLYPNDGAHGLEVSYYNNTTLTGTPVVTRLEPNVYSDWGSKSPDPTVNADNFSSLWLGRIESPYTGAVKLCVDAADDVKLSVDGALVMNRTGTTSNVCTADLHWVAGTTYVLRIEHKEFTSSALLRLRYQYAGVTEAVPSTNLYPPSGWVAPTKGLTVAYYDSETFNATLPPNPVTQQAFVRYDPTVDFDWGGGRAEYSLLTSSSTWSARWTGQLTVPCDGIYEFKTSGNVDDGVRMWLDGTRVLNRWRYAAVSGATYLTAGAHDFKTDYYQGSGGDAIRLQWKTHCTGATSFVAIPTDNFSPTGDAGTAGFVRSGGDNGNESSYSIWNVPNASGVSPSDATPNVPGRWGLGESVMMVPTFAPDNSKLAFIDGDSGGGAGWRKGLSVFDFDANTSIFRNRRQILNTWPNGNVLKWPTFESDSRSLIVQESVPADFCCRAGWTKYGYMAPTNYYEDPSRLSSVDVTASDPVAVPLVKLNAGERAIDANKAYQATVLPTAAGGYRWAVFTSTRPYGNLVNAPAVQQDYSNMGSYTPMLNSYSIQSQLWVAALDDSPSGSTDRSHPAFWLPNQSFSTQASSGYINERAFWVLESCGSAGANCEVDDDCCGGTSSPRSSVCRIDVPVSSPVTRHCANVPTVGTCMRAGGACSSTADCCIGAVCASGLCAAPPPIVQMGPANYERVFGGQCDQGTTPVWRFFDWQGSTPDDSFVEFYAESASSEAALHTLPALPAAVTTPGVVRVATAQGEPTVSWTGASVDLALDHAGLASRPFLKITMRFSPDSALRKAPVLTAWRQSYSCVPNE